MIIGIDEVGDFGESSETYNYFVSVLIDQNEDNYRIKNELFKQWESTIPDKFKKNKDGEIKGRDLLEEHLASFYYHVYNNIPSTLCAIIRVNPTGITHERIKTLQDNVLKQIDQQIESLLTKEDNSKIIKEYGKLRSWYKNRNYNEILKMECMQVLLSLSFKIALEYGQLTYLLKGDISNLQNIRFLIDKDFIKARETTTFYKEIFMQYWQCSANDFKFTIMTDVWTEKEHPIWKVFEKLEDGRAGVKKAFNDKIYFDNSHQHWEVRMADILGTIIHRYENHGKCKLLANELYTQLNTSNYIHLDYQK